MADLIINGTTYSGSPTNTTNPQRPSTLTRKRMKIGRTLVAADGSTSFVSRGERFMWTITWNRANSVTQAAVYAVRGLTSTFSYTDFNTTVYTVLTVNDDDYEEHVWTDAANALKYDLTLILRQA